jgi:RNA 2',3'-cyclic 3'-phosphodiesterase
VEELSAAVGDAAVSVTSGVAQARGFGAFPNARRPRAVWAGFEDPTRVFARLEESISARLASLGRPREERPFSAHLTVARMREGVRDFGPLPARLAAAARTPPVFGTVSVASVTFYRSELGRDGARYTALARFPLTHP